MTFLPCPFCGSSNVELRSGPFATCMHCGAEGPIGDDADSAQEAWNTRTFKVMEAQNPYADKASSDKSECEPKADSDANQ